MVGFIWSSEASRAFQPVLRKQSLRPLIACCLSYNFSTNWLVLATCNRFCWQEEEVKDNDRSCMGYRRVREQNLLTKERVLPSAGNSCLSSWSNTGEARLHLYKYSRSTYFLNSEEKALLRRMAHHYFSPKAVGWGYWSGLQVLPSASLSQCIKT